MIKEKENIFEIVCPQCGAFIWIDGSLKSVIKVEKGRKKKESLEDLLAKERERQAAFDRKFEATAELEKKKKEKAREKFEKALEQMEDD
ncbi:MAG: hypothetical protein N3B16_12020 [Candidatus Aminicenantes bacterium]|nr:hypothetical protein [Candidatus Aminicenantes bacterium]